MVNPWIGAHHQKLPSSDDISFKSCSFSTKQLVYNAELSCPFQRHQDCLLKFKLLSVVVIQMSLQLIFKKHLQLFKIAFITYHVVASVKCHLL